MSHSSITDTQCQVLEHALDHAEGRIDWFPESVKGGARAKVLQGLLNRALIMLDGDHHLVAEAGYEALGRDLPNAKAIAAAEPAAHDAELEQEVAAAEAQWQGEANTAETNDAARTAPSDAAAVRPEPRAKTPRAPRTDSKQALVIGLLRRPEGVTVEQVQAATGWLPHSVRGLFAVALKKRLGLNVVSEKNESGERRYRIVDAHGA
ncbi:DUF3489 domain-containing protein [Aquabacterium sp. A7-Y]|uniref:DUF3489 domain-containing protein n=1 Tax=Aquabacterium sp. A7-Y TaxID=1349605 RepID=UPI00223CA902|nr:DUF3489 domain-containing protein [Aquabacterium sp. A7-Y]MCW7540655.1 DUF3489 domain-containing protein [Aquabacterium sp. A7-Y]